MKKPPKRIDLDLQQVDALLKRVEAGILQEGDYEIIKAMVETIHLLSNAKKPEVVVRITGKPPLSGTVYYIQRLRCNACGEIFKAAPADGIGDEKYDAESGAMIALLKYGSGMPFNRLEGLQASLGVPLAASTQWEIVEQVADRIYPAYLELNFQGAQGDVVYNDDTTAKILELMKENKEEDAPERKGMFTTGIMSTSGERQIALFYTGRKHAGENMDDLLRRRQTHLQKPIQMCDGLSRNVPKTFETILLNCLAHGRRNFVDVAASFPDECQHILEALAKVYKNDEIAKERKMAPDQRLSFHQMKSSPIMKDLKTWLDEQLNQNKVEPNSGLGQAISYMIKHWKELTGFLRIKNAPPDNNLCYAAIGIT